MYELPVENLTVEEFARVNSMSVATVRRYVRDGILPYFQPGGPRHRIYIPRDALVRRNLNISSAESGFYRLQDYDAKRIPGPTPNWRKIPHQ